MRRILLSIALVAGLGATAAGQAPAAKTTSAPSDSAKVGAYDLELLTDNGTTTGELTIKRERDQLTASVAVGGHSPATKSFVRTGAAYVLSAGTAEFTVTYTLTFSRDSLHGKFAMQGGPGLSGTVIGALRR